MHLLPNQCIAVCMMGVLSVNEAVLPLHVCMCLCKRIDNEALAIVHCSCGVPVLWSRSPCVQQSLQ